MSHSSSDVEGRSTRPGRELFVPRRIADLATAQDGLITTTQLRAFGVGDDTILRWTRAGWLHRWHEGVHAVGHRALTQRGRRRAAVLAAGEGAALSHLAAAVHLDLLRWRLDVIDVIVPRSGERDREGLAFHRPRIYEPALDTRMVDGIRCTTVARTLVDLASAVGHDPLERAVERAEYLDVIDLRAIADVLGRISRPRGVRTLRRCLGPERLDAALTESNLERTLLRLLLGAGLERPVLQAPFELAPGRWVRADFFWPRHALIVEADGPHHTRPIQAAADARRDTELRARGLRVHRIPHTIIEDDPARAVAIVHGLLAASRDE
jgi:very-short-patch-repair endonuclease